MRPIQMAQLKQFRTRVQLLLALDQHARFILGAHLRTPSLLKIHAMLSSQPQMSMLAQLFLVNQLLKAHKRPSMCTSHVSQKQRLQLLYLFEVASATLLLLMSWFLVVVMQLHAQPLQTVLPTKIAAIRLQHSQLTQLLHQARLLLSPLRVSTMQLLKVSISIPSRTRSLRMKPWCDLV
jgi:hypothetical protein